MSAVHDAAKVRAKATLDQAEEIFKQGREQRSLRNSDTAKGIQDILAGTRVIDREALQQQKSNDLIPKMAQLEDVVRTHDDQVERSMRILFSDPREGYGQADLDAAQRDLEDALSRRDEMRLLVVEYQREISRINVFSTTSQFVEHKQQYEALKGTPEQQKVFDAMLEAARNDRGYGSLFEQKAGPELNLRRQDVQVNAYRDSLVANAEQEAGKLVGGREAFFMARYR
ncbi:hypothetical protein [Geopseudomonas aromaticivorans]